MSLLFDTVRDRLQAYLLTGKNNGNLKGMLPGTMVHVCNPSTWKPEVG